MSETSLYIKNQMSRSLMQICTILLLRGCVMILSKEIEHGYLH